MSRRLLSLSTVLIAVMAFGIATASVWAKPKNEGGDSITASVKLTSTTTVGSTKLAAGEYKVVVEGGKAKFEQGGKTVAEVSCTVKDFPGKINQTTFVLDHDQMTEIQVAGKSKAIDF
jgi:hypothetical protein